MQKSGFIISVLTLLLSCACMVHAQAAPDDAETFYAADSTYILYKTGVSAVDTTFYYNGESLDHFISSVHMTKEHGSKVYVEINSGASPEGNADDNRRLSGRRTEELASYILGHLCVKGFSGYSYHMTRDLCFIAGVALLLYLALLFGLDLLRRR